MLKIKLSNKSWRAIFVLLIFALVIWLIFVTTTPHYVAAKKALQQHKAQKAIVHFQKALKQSPDLREYSLYYLAASYFEKKDYPNAKQTYQKLIEEYPISTFSKEELHKKILEIEMQETQPDQLTPAKLFEYGKYLAQKFDYGPAIVVFEDLLKKYPNIPVKTELYYFLADSYRGMNQFDLAKKYYSRVVYVPFQYQTAAIVSLARIYRQENNGAAAVQLFSYLLNSNPSSKLAPSSLYNIASVYEERGNIDQAINHYQQLINRYPKSYLVDDAYFKIANFYMNMNQKNLAYQKFLNGFNNVPFEDLSAGLGYYAGLMAGELGNAEQKKLLWEKVLSDHDHNYYAYVIANRLNIKSLPFNKLETSSDDKRLIKVSALYDFFYKYKQYDDAAIELKNQMKNFPASDRVKLNLHLADILFKAQKYNQSIEIASGVLLPSLYKKSQTPVSPEFWKYAYPLGYQETVFHYANLYGVDPYFALAVIREESRFNPNVISWARAHGLMQVIPPTGEALAKKLNIPHFNEQMLLDPEISIRMGVYYLKMLFDAHPDNPILVLAHYNAGPVATDRWLKAKGNKDWIEFIESITYRETRFYVKKVLSSYWEYRRIYTNSTGITLPK